MLKGQCLAYGEGITYWPVLEIIRSAAGIGVENPADIRERIAAFVPGPDGELVGERLAGLLGLGPTPGADDIAWALRRLLEALARQRPLVVVVDDLQQAEPTLLDLLESLAERSHGAPILLVGTARPELLSTRPAWGGGKANTMTVSLEPLDAHDSGLLLANLPGGSQLSPELRGRVVEAAGGHPFFVEELLTMLREQGRAPGGGDRLSLPPTVQALLAARLERLSEPERLLLECGAVEGGTFHAAALTTLAPELTADASAAALAALLRKDLLRPADSQLAGEAYRFRHALLREQAYAALPKTRRANLHEVFAAWLERAGAKRLAELEEILAYHLEQALPTTAGARPPSTTKPRRSASAPAGCSRTQAAGPTNGRTCPPQRSLLGRAAELLPPDDTERLRLLIDLGDALRAGGEFERAAAVLTDAATRSEATGRHANQAHAELELALLGSYTDAVHGLEEMARAAAGLIADPAAAEDRVAIAKAYYLLGLWHWNHLESGTAANLFLQARETADEAGAPSVRRQAQLFFALTFVNGPMPVPGALTALADFLEAAHGDRRAEACLMIYAGVLESMRGRFDEGRSLLAQGAERLDDLGHRVLRANLDHYAVLAELAAGDPRGAARIARRALKTLRAVGDREAVAVMASALAEALHNQGRDEEAEPELALAADVAGAPLFRARVDTTRAKVLAGRGEAAAAEALARETIAMLEATDALALRGDAQLALCEALAATGRLDEAASAADEAEALYNAKGADALAAQAAAKRQLLRMPQTD